MSKTVDPTTVSPDDSLTYTITFSNIGTAVAYDVLVTDVLPISLTNVSVISSGVMITQSGATFDVESLAPNTAGLITITAEVSPGLAAGVFTNTATITTPTVDSDTLNNSASASDLLCQWLFPLVGRRAATLI